MENVTSTLDAFKLPVSQKWNTVDLFVPFIVFVFFLELDVIFLSSGLKQGISFFFFLLYLSLALFLSRVRVLRPFAAHLQYLEGSIAWQVHAELCMEETVPLYDIKNNIQIIHHMTCCIFDFYSLPSSSQYIVIVHFLPFRNAQMCF